MIPSHLCREKLREHARRCAGEDVCYLLERRAEEESNAPAAQLSAGWDADNLILDTVLVHLQAADRFAHGVPHIRHLAVG